MTQKLNANSNGICGSTDSEEARESYDSLIWCQKYYLSSSYIALVDTTRYVMRHNNNWRIFVKQRNLRNTVRYIASHYILYMKNNKIHWIMIYQIREFNCKLQMKYVVKSIALWWFVWPTSMSAKLVFSIVKLHDAMDGHDGLAAKCK